MAPIIGIPECYKFENYKYAIEEHESRVKKLIRNEQTTEEFIDGIHGLLLPGGGDIDPKNFGEKRHPKVKFVDEERDEFEFSLFREAIEKDIPVFGVCRGIQIMNVAMGGSLYQDIPTEVGEHLTYKIPEKSDDPWHKIKIQPDSRLNKITHESITEVTSSHHQAVNRIGEGFEVAAQSKDGIVEAMEDPSKEFVIGVQYHPERMWIDENQPELGLRKHAKRLFKTFINAAKTYSANHK